MKKVTLFIVLVCFSLSGASAAKWSNGQQKQNAKKADVWTRFSDAELCEKLNLSKKGSSMKRMLNAERLKRRIKCKG